MSSVSEVSSGYVTASEVPAVGMPVVPVGRCVNRLGRVTVEEDGVASESSDDMGVDFASSSEGDVESNGDSWLSADDEMVTAGTAGVSDRSGERWVSGTGGCPQEEN